MKKQLLAAHQTENLEALRRSVVGIGPTDEQVSIELFFDTGDLSLESSSIITPHASAKSARHVAPQVVENHDLLQVRAIMSRMQISHMESTLASDPYGTNLPTSINWRDSVGRRKAINVFAFSIMLSDEYLRLRNSETTLTPKQENAARFFRMIQQLPLEMQMLCANIQSNSSADIINSTEIDCALKSIFMQYERGM